MNVRFLAVALSVSVMVTPHPAEADSAFDVLAEKVRQAELREPGVPIDLSLYGGMVTYGHSSGEAHASPAAKLLKRIGVEQESFKHFVAGRVVKPVRFVAGGDTIVAETELSGTLPDQTETAQQSYPADAGTLPPQTSAPMTGTTSAVMPVQIQPGTSTGTIIWGVVSARRWPSISISLPPGSS